MLSTALVALLFGAASAFPSVASYKEQYVWSYKDAFTFTGTYEADAGYRTGYASTSGTSTTSSNNIEIYSYLNFTVKMEYYNTYYHEYTFSFIPFDVYPYQQVTTMTRPESGEASSSSTTGMYSIEALKFETTVRENTKTCGASFVDAAMGTGSIEPTCAYDANKEVKYVDPYWHWAPLSGESWYGQHAYYTQVFWQKWEQIAS